MIFRISRPGLFVPQYIFVAEVLSIWWLHSCHSFLFDKVFEFHSRDAMLCKFGEQSLGSSSNIFSSVLLRSYGSSNWSFVKFCRTWSWSSSSTLDSLILDIMVHRSGILAHLYYFHLVLLCRLQSGGTVMDLKILVTGIV